MTTEEKIAIGTRIMFIKELVTGPTGDHPALLYASIGDLGEIVSYDAHEGYMVKTLDHAGTFGASSDEFDIDLDPKEIDKSTIKDLGPRMKCINYDRLIKCFDIDKDSVQSLPVETNSKGFFQHIQSDRHVLRVFDYSDDSVYFYDCENLRPLLYFNSSCDVYAPVKLGKLHGSILEYGLIGHLRMIDDGWDFETYDSERIPDLKLDAESPMIAEIKFFDIWNTTAFKTLKESVQWPLQNV